MTARKQSRTGSRSLHQKGITIDGAAARTAHVPEGELMQWALTIDKVSCGLTARAHTISGVAIASLSTMWLIRVAQGDEQTAYKDRMCGEHRFRKSAHSGLSQNVRIIFRMDVQKMRAQRMSLVVQENALISCNRVSPNGRSQQKAVVKSMSYAIQTEKNEQESRKMCPRTMAAVRTARSHNPHFGW